MLVAVLNIVIGVLLFVFGMWQLTTRIVPSGDAALHRMTADMIAQAEAAREGVFYIHVPDEGCPAGWTLEPDLFKFKDQDVPGCVRVLSQNGQLTMDYLRAGEGSHHTIAIPVEELRKLKPRV